MRLLQLQLTLIYLTSGGSKLLDADWRSGVVLADRVVRYGSRAIALGVPHAIVDFLRSPLGGHLMAKGTIATELGLAVLLWVPRTRRLAAWAGIVFHVTIDLDDRRRRLQLAVDPDLVLVRYVRDAERIAQRCASPAANAMMQPWPRKNSATMRSVCSESAHCRSKLHDMS